MNDKSCVSSVSSHCDNLLITATKKEIKILNIFYNKILRYSCGARKNTSVDELHLFTGLYNVHHKIETNIIIY